jgi:hypothetical protein
MESYEQTLARAEKELNAEGRSVYDLNNANEYLGEMARVIFVTSPRPISAYDLASREPFSLFVKKQTMNQWAMAGRWRDQRRIYWSRVAQQVEDRVGQQQVDFLSDAMMQLTNLNQQLQNELVVEDVHYRSREGLISAYLAVMKQQIDVYNQMREFQESVKRDGGPEENKQGNTLSIESKFSREEAMQAAKQVMAMRRAETRKELASGQQAKNGGEAMD